MQSNTDTTIDTNIDTSEIMGICQSTESPSKRPMSSSPHQTDFQYDNQGRRLHADFTPLNSDAAVTSQKVYILPNDDEEMDRLHLQHYIVRFLFRSNFSAPVARGLTEGGRRVLDVGCGSGIWAFEVGWSIWKVTVLGSSDSGHTLDFLV